MILRWYFDVLTKNLISHLLICAIICQRPHTNLLPYPTTESPRILRRQGGTKYQGEKSLASLFVWKVFNWLTFTSQIFASHLSNKINPSRPHWSSRINWWWKGNNIIVLQCNNQL
jgi:hypothetical protein